MKIDYGSILVLAFAPLVLRIAFYYVALRVRAIRVSFLQLVVIAAAPYLVAVIPLPLPHIVSVFLSLFAGIYLLMHYAEVELYPDGIFVPLAVEVASAVLIPILLSPFVT